MKSIKEYKNIVLDILKLSMPILGGNLAQILVGVSDTIVAGRYSTVALGAISVASAIVMTVIIGAIGLALSVSPVISNLRGQKKNAKNYFLTTIIFSIVISIPFYLILEIILLFIDKIGLSPDMLPDIKEYIRICAISVFPATIFIAIKEFLQAFEKVVFTNFLMLFMVILNTVLNVVLTFGYGDIPSMGVKGLSIATLTSRIISMVLILIYCIPLLKPKMKLAYEKIQNYLNELIKVGTPISLAMFFEFLGFNLTAVLIGKFSSLFAGVHNIILCIANFSFMIFLSVSNAASVKIGFFNGKKDRENLVKYAKTNIFLIILICFITFAIVGFGQDIIISAFSQDKEVLFWSKKIIKIAMCFLFFDGLQCACVGILKGLKDTKIVAFAMILGYLTIAIPTGIYFAYCKNIILEGFWIGLALALFTVAMVTGGRVMYKLRKMRKE